MKNEDVLLRNNSGNKSKDTLVEGFVIRLNEFDEILQNISNAFPNSIKTHYLILGLRGSGKTTLLHRLKYAILDTDELKDRILPVIFSEEQYYLGDLTNLWEAIAIYLEDHFGFTNLSKEVEEIIAENDLFESAAFNLIETELLSANKRLVIFIENINVFFKKLSEKELYRFKEILTSNPLIQLIGSSTSYNDGSIDFSKSFYNFLSIQRLDGLTKDECERLLLKIGEQYGDVAQIQFIIDNHPGRIEALRRLTGGVPRTISYLFQIFLDNENGKAIKDLYVLIDTLTVLYKSELDQLSSQQQKVIDAIARKWDAVTVKEIVKKTRLESKNVSSILAILERNQLIEKIPTNTKNNLYRIKERFMNIWYLMRFGRKHDRDNVIWLVRFFDAWCDETQLTNILKAHIDNLKVGEYDVNAAIDMGNTFLSCENISESLKLELIKITNSILPERLLGKVRLPGKDVLEKIKLLLDQRQFDKAIASLDEIENKDVNYHLLASSLYLMAGEYHKSLESAKAVLELDSTNSTAALSLGIIYEDYINDAQSAETYYRMSLSQKPFHPYAANRLGNLVYERYKDLEQAEKYHRKAIAKNFKSSLLSLGEILYKEDEFEKAEVLLSEAIEAQVEGANIALAKLYVALKNTKAAKLYFEKAVSASERGALINYGLWYQNKKRPNYEKAQALFEKVIADGDLEGYGRLGRLYRIQKNIPQAVSIYKKGVKLGNSESAHQLGHVYSSQQKFDESDKMFLKAAELGDTLAILCLVSGIYSKGRIDKKQFALNVLEEYLPSILNDYPAQIFYAKILLWNQELQQSVEVVKGSYDQVLSIIEKEDDGSDDGSLNQVMSQLFSYMILLLAKKEFKACLDLFEDTAKIDLKVMLKPIYFVLMESLKDQFPTEYLMAGDELKDTINEIKTEIADLKTLL